MLAVDRKMTSPTLVDRFRAAMRRTAAGVAVLPDQRIIAAGGVLFPFNGSDFFLARYKGVDDPPVVNPPVGNPPAATPPAPPAAKKKKCKKKKRSAVTAKKCKKRVRQR